MWKELCAEDRQHWEDEAMKEREQYAVEKAAYTGPWKVPHKRVKKVRLLNLLKYLKFTRRRYQMLRLIYNFVRKPLSI